MINLLGPEEKVNFLSKMQNFLDQGTFLGGKYGIPLEFVALIPYSDLLDSEYEMEEDLKFKKNEGDIVVNRRRSYKKESFSVVDPSKNGNENKETVSREEGGCNLYSRGDVLLIL